MEKRGEHHSNNHYFINKKADWLSGILLLLHTKNGSTDILHFAAKDKAGYVLNKQKKTNNSNLSYNFRGLLACSMCVHRFAHITPHNSPPLTQPTPALPVS